MKMINTIHLKCLKCSNKMAVDERHMSEYIECSQCHTKYKVLKQAAVIQLSALSTKTTYTYNLEEIKQNA